MDNAKLPFMAPAPFTSNCVRSRKSDRTYGHRLGVYGLAGRVHPNPKNSRDWHEVRQLCRAVLCTSTSEFAEPSPSQRAPPTPISRKTSYFAGPGDRAFFV